MSEEIITVRIYANIVLKSFCEVCQQKQQCLYTSLSECPHLISFRREIKDRMQDYKAAARNTKICNICGKEKSVMAFCLNRNSPDGRAYYCKDCDKIKKSTNRKRKKAEKNKPSKRKERVTKYKTTAQRAYAIINARRQYYDPSCQYLLKKYLHRHEKQLQLWEEKEKIFTKALLEEKSNEVKKTIEKRLMSAQRKIKYLRELIEKERNSLK